MRDPIEYHQLKWKGLLKIKSNGFSTIKVIKIDDRLEEKPLEMIIQVDL